MAAPNLLVVDAKGGGTARVYMLRGGLFAEAIGGSLSGGKIDTGGTLAYLRNAAVRFRGRLYCTLGGIVYRYNEDTNVWDVDLDFRPGSPWSRDIKSDATQNARHSGLHVYAVGTNQYMAVWYYDQFNVISVNYTDGRGQWFVSAAPSGVSACIPDSSFDYNGNLYMRSSPDQGTNTCVYMTPGGSVIAQNSLQNNRKHGCFFLLDDRLFYIAPWWGGSGFLSNFVEELVLGSWVARLTGSVPFGTDGEGNCDSMKIGDEVFVFGPYDSAGGNADGLACHRMYVGAPGGAIQTQDVSNPVVPAVIRHGGATIGDVSAYRCWCFVDNETTPGSPVGYVMFQSGDASEAVTLFQFNGAAAEMSVVGTPAADGDFGFGSNPFGGGHTLNGKAGSTPLVTGKIKRSDQGTQGLKFQYEVYGDPTRLDHGAVAGGPFEEGETIQGGTSLATATMDLVGSTGLYVKLEDVQGGPFQPGEVITQTSGAATGATATLEHVLAHGAVSGGPFEVGESILGSISLATAVITEVDVGLIKVDTVVGGPFQSGETITQTTGINSGANGVLSAGPAGSTGGLADKVVRFRYFLGAGSTGQGVPSTGLCTLIPGTLVGGGALQSGNTEIGGLLADDATREVSAPAQAIVTRTVEWDFLGDGVPEGLLQRVQLEVSRP
jgi:hypothetical protein